MRRLVRALASLPLTRLGGASLVALVALAAAGIAVRVRADMVADALFDRDPSTLRWADAVAESLDGADAPRDDPYDGEQDVIRCSLGVLGLAAVAGDDPALRERYRGAIGRCARWLASPAARGILGARWGEDALQTWDPAPVTHGHAYLGWIAAGLAAARPLVGDPEVDRVEEALVDRLVASLAALPPASFETYPGEVYPTDQAAVLAAVALDGRHRAAVDAWLPRWEAVAVDPVTGLQHQRVRVGSGAPADELRGSGTTISAFFLGYVDRPRAVALARAARGHLAGSVLGLGGVREVPRGAPFRMDIDSGPVVPGVGFGVAATGFGMANARLLGDRSWFRACHRSAYLFGVPVPRWYVAGGALGNAVLLAAAAAPPEVSR